MLAGQAATAVAHQKAIMRQVGMAATRMHPMEVIVLDGKLVIGFAPGELTLQVDETFLIVFL